jgi:arylformamidase
VQIYDVTWPLFPGMPAFPNNPDLRLTPVHSLARGEAYNLSELSLGTHSGTHVDPPSHFLPTGATAERLDLTVLNGPCRVVRIPDAHAEIGVADLKGLLHGLRRVLFRTRNSGRWVTEARFFPDYVAVSPEAAEYIGAAGLKLVGIDSLSVERDSTGQYPVHHTLLESGCLILEGLQLANVPEGEYELRCLPLRLQGGDGAPCRAVLIAP